MDLRMKPAGAPGAAGGDIVKEATIATFTVTRSAVHTWAESTDERGERPTASRASGRVSNSPTVRPRGVLAT